MDLDFIKIINCCSSKDNVKRMKTQDMTWDKIFSEFICDKGFVSRNIKQSQNSIRKCSNQFKKWQNI